MPGINNPRHSEQKTQTQGYPLSPHRVLLQPTGTSAPSLPRNPKPNALHTGRSGREEEDMCIPIAMAGIRAQTCLNVISTHTRGDKTGTFKVWQKRRVHRTGSALTRGVTAYKECADKESNSGRLASQLRASASQTQHRVLPPRRVTFAPHLGSLSHLSSVGNLLPNIK